MDHLVSCWLAAVPEELCLCLSKNRVSGRAAQNCNGVLVHWCAGLVVYWCSGFLVKCCTPTYTIREVGTVRPIIGQMHAATPSRMEDDTAHVQCNALSSWKLQEG